MQSIYISNPRLNVKSYPLQAFRQRFNVQGNLFDFPNEAKKAGYHSKSYWREQGRNIIDGSSGAIVPTSIKKQQGISWEGQLVLAEEGNSCWVVAEWDEYFRLDQTEPKNAIDKKEDNKENSVKVITSFPFLPSYEVTRPSNFDINPINSNTYENRSSARFSQKPVSRQGQRNDIYEPLNVYFPETLNPDDYPDSAKWILHLIYLLPVINRQPRSDYQPLKNDYLREVLGRKISDNVKRQLIQTGIIESDNHYVQGEKSIGYRVNESLQQATWRLVEIHDRRIIKQRERRKPVWAYLEQQLKRITAIVPSDEELTKLAEGDEDRKLSVPDMVQIYKDSLNAINDGVWYFDYDNAPGRLFTNLTNLKRELRSTLRVDGKPLMEIDIKCSQGVILAHYQRYNEATRKPDKELEQVLENDLYAILATLAGTTRDKAKAEFVEHILFGANGYRSKVKKAFEQRFPKSASFLKGRKEIKGGANQLAVELQRFEAKIVIHKTAERIRKERPNTFLATIHDSLLTLPDDFDYVYQTFAEELKAAKLNTRLKGKQI